MEDVPFKKRRCWYQSITPPAPTFLRDHEESNSFEHLGKSEKSLENAYSLNQKSHSENGVIHGSVKVTSGDGPCVVRNGRNVVTPVAVVPMEETVVSLEPDRLVKTESVDRQGLLVQVDSLTSSTDFHSDKSDGALGKSIPLKNNRLHWDLNIMMDEWEEPYAESFKTQISNSEYITDDGMQNGKVTSDPDSIQKIADPQCMLLETKGPDLERKVLEVSYGLIKTEKTCAALKTEAPDLVISMNGLHDNPKLDHTECKFIEQRNNIANMPVQYEKDISGTPATVLCKLSSQSNTTEKSDSVSVDMPITGKSACYADFIKDEGSEDLKRKSGGNPKLTSEDLSSGCNNSNVSGNNLGHVVSVECMSNLQSGYDSPIEDGELREPVAYFWENNEVESSETGQLDNGLVGTDYTNALENNYKNRNQLCDHQDDANAKGQDDELDDKGSLTREFGARKYRKKLSSHSESPYSGPIKRKNFAFMQQQRKNENYGCEVDFPVAYQESRSYYSHSHRGSEDQDLSRLRRVNSSPTAGGNEMSFHDNRQLLNKFSNDMYRPSTRRRSPAVRDDSYDSCRRAHPLRGNNNLYNKEKFGIYPQRGMRAPKEEYNECLPEKYSSRRDHGFSPDFDQAAHISRPYRKSQSGSSVSSPTHVSNEKDQRSFGRVSRHSQRQRGNHVEFPRRLKSDGNLRSLVRPGKNSQVATGRRCSFEDSDYDRNVHYDKFKK